MKRSATIYLDLTEEEKQSILETMGYYTTVFDMTGKTIIAEKTINKKKLHHLIYQDCKEACPKLPVALLQAARDVAVESVKSENSKNRKNKKKKKNMFSNLPKRQKYSSMRYNKKTMTLRGQQFTFSTCNKRIKKNIELPDFFKERYGDWEFIGGNIGIDKKGRVFANLIFENEEIEARTDGTTVGVDRGIYNPVATSEGEIYDAKRIRRVKRRQSYNRKTCQAKGTLSAKKRLKSLSGKEKRFGQNENHITSKALASNPNVKTYVLEDLSKIYLVREKKNKKTCKGTRGFLSNWSYSDFEFKLKYKCYKNGINVVKVDPRFTSQTCSVCGNVDKKARYKNKYICSMCGHTEHADINAAKNIRDKYLLTQVS